MAVTSRMLRERGQRQARELGIDPARVPPGQYLSKGFPVLTVGDIPPFDLASWDLQVFGAVRRELSLSWDELLALPQKEVATDIPEPACTRTVRGRTRSKRPPERYFWKSAKFLRRIEVMTADRMGFWELNGYHNDADPWQEQRHWF